MSQRADLTNSDQLLKFIESFVRNFESYWQMSPNPFDISALTFSRMRWGTFLK